MEFQRSKNDPWVFSPIYIYISVIPDDRGIISHEISSIGMDFFVQVLTFIIATPQYFLKNLCSELGYM